MRFPEFADEWKKYRCSDLLSFFSTNSFSWDMLDYEATGMLNLHYGLIHSGAPTLIDVSKYALPKIKKNIEIRNYELCEDGDIAFADASEDTAETCKPVEITKCNNQKIVCGLHTIHARDKKGITIVGFKGYAFSSLNFHKQVHRLAQGTKIYSVSVRNFSEMHISIPSTDEQIKIKSLLWSLDRRIEIQNKIIEKLQSQMKAIYHQLFSQKPIEVKPLQEFYKRGKAGGTPTSTKKEYYGGNIPFLSISDMTTQGKFVYVTEKFLTEKGLDNSSAWIVSPNSLIMSMYASVGLVAINKVPLATSQAMFSMVLNNNADLEFLYYYLNYFKNNKLRRLLETGTQSNINADVVKEISIPNYGNKNQQITELLRRYDMRIEIEKDILTAYKKQKAYLLREMFI